LIEIQTQWSLGDIVRANQALDVLEEVERRQAKLFEAKQKGR